MNEEGWTAFHFACNTGNLNIINLFLTLNRKIDLKKRTTKLYCNNLTCFDILKSKNINLNFDKIQKDKISNNEKLLFSAADGYLELLRLLLKRSKRKFK